MSYEFPTCKYQGRFTSQVYDWVHAITKRKHNDRKSTRVSEKFKLSCSCFVDLFFLFLFTQPAKRASDLSGQLSLLLLLLLMLLLSAKNKWSMTDEHGNERKAAAAAALLMSHCWQIHETTPVCMVYQRGEVSRSEKRWRRRRRRGSERRGEKREERRGRLSSPNHVSCTDSISYSYWGKVIYQTALF